MPTTQYSDRMAQYERDLQKSRPITSSNTFKKRPIERVDNIAEIIFGMVIVGVIVWASLFLN